MVRSRGRADEEGAVAGLEVLVWPRLRPATQICFRSTDEWPPPSYRRIAGILEGYVNSITPVIIVRSPVSTIAWRPSSSVYFLVITDVASIFPFSINFT